MKKSHITTAILSAIVTISLIVVGYYYFYQRHLWKNIEQPEIIVDIQIITQTITLTDTVEAKIIYVEKSVHDTSQVSEEVKQDSIAYGYFEPKKKDYWGTLETFYNFNTNKSSYLLKLTVTEKVFKMKETHFLPRPRKFLRPIVGIGGCKSGGGILGGVAINEKLLIFPEFNVIEFDKEIKSVIWLKAIYIF